MDEEIIDDDSSLVLEEKPSEAFMIDTIKKLQHQINVYRVTVEGLQTELSTERAMHKSTVARLEEEIETQSRLIETLKQKLHHHHSSPSPHENESEDDSEESDDDDDNDDEGKTDEDEHVEIDVKNGEESVDGTTNSDEDDDGDNDDDDDNDTNLSIEKVETSSQTINILLFDESTQTSEEIFQITKQINELLSVAPSVKFDPPPSARGDRRSVTPTMSSHRATTPRRPIPIQSSSSMNQLGSDTGIHVISYTTPNHSQELLLQQMMIQLEELKKILSVNSIDRMVGLLLRAEETLRSNNALENWMLLARISKLQSMLDIILSGDHIIRMDKRVAFSKMIKYRVERLIKDRIYRREKYRLARQTMYEHWIYCIFETLKYQSEVTHRGGSLSYRAIDPKHQLKAMIDKFDSIEGEMTSNLYTSRKMEPKLTNRDKMKLNAIAPLFNHNFADMTISRRKTVLFDLLDFVYHARLDQVTETGMDGGGDVHGGEEFEYEDGSPAGRKENPAPPSLQLATRSTFTPRPPSSSLLTPRDSRVNHDRMPGFRLSMPNIIQQMRSSRSVSPPQQLKPRESGGASSISSSAASSSSSSSQVFKRRYRMSKS